MDGRMEGEKRKGKKKIKVGRGIRGKDGGKRGCKIGKKNVRVRK